MEPFQQLISKKDLPFCYDKKSRTTLPELGEDHSYVYGYTQAHKILELWLGICKAYNVDVRVNETSPAARCFIGMPTVVWNKYMGNIDTVQKVI